MISLALCETRPTNTFIRQSIFPNPAQPDASPFAFYLQDLHIDDISHFDDGPSWDLRTVEQAILLDADIHKGAEVHHVAHRPLQLHPREQVFDFEHIRAQQGSGSIGARIPARADQLFQNIIERGKAAVQFFGQIFTRFGGEQRLDGRDPFLQRRFEG